MDGVTILSEMSVRGEEIWSVIAVVILTLSLIAATIWDNIEHWHYCGWVTRIIGIICGLIFCCFASMLAVFMCFEYNTFHAEYKIIIDDSVGFNEFMGCYEILSNDGDVYTVIDRQVD